MEQSASEARERFSGLFEEHYAAVHAYAARRVGPDLADEVTAETFLVAWRRLDVIPAAVLPWLYGVAHNVILRQRHASAVQARTQAQLASEPQGPWFDDEVENESLWAAWRKLSDTDREVLALTVWEELPVRDAAQALGLPASVVSVRLHRARRRLEKHLGPTPSPDARVVEELK